MKSPRNVSGPSVLPAEVLLACQVIEALMLKGLMKLDRVGMQIHLYRAMDPKVFSSCFSGTIYLYLLGLGTSEKSHELRLSDTVVEESNSLSNADVACFTFSAK